jgi:dihydrofolate synthase/folylpolyglutamate synthase
MRTLEAWLALLEQRHPRTIDLGLERCGLVYSNLGSPRPAQKVFTVAGTNGKGSTVAYLAAMSGSLGQRYGTYTSPHVLRFNERISIMGEPVPDEVLVSAFEQVEMARADVSLTYFEFTTLAAFVILQQAKLDCAVLEVGLGGRLDTVNLVDADCALITPIGLDHQDFLGPDIDSIASEKAGIMRAGIPVVCTESKPPAAVLQTAEDLQVRLYRRGHDFDLGECPGPDPEYKKKELVFSLGDQSMKISRPPMAGKHQADNLAAALAALVLMNPSCLEKQAAIAAAIGHIHVPGRLQSIQTSPTILIDVGHNTLAAGVVAEYLQQSNQTDVICILAMLADKPVESVALALDGVCRRWLCADSPGDRGQSGQLLAARVRAALPAAKVNSFREIDAAMEKALSIARKVDTILVFGSFSTAADTFTWQKNRLKLPQ